MIQIGPSAREETIGIVEKIDTATHAITAGQYVVWKGVGCVAASDISVGDTLSSSNLTAVSNGIANDIKSKIPPVSDSLSDTSTTNALSAAKGKALNDSLTTLNTQIANMDEDTLLTEFTGTSSASVNLSVNANNFRLIVCALYNSSNNLVGSVTISPLYARNVIILVYGESNSQWGSVLLSNDYASAEMNRTSSNTSKLRIIGVLKK